MCDVHMYCYDVCNMGTLYTKQLFLRTMIYTYTYPCGNRYILTEEDISNKGDTRGWELGHLQIVLIREVVIEHMTHSYMRLVGDIRVEYQMEFLKNSAAVCFYDRITNGAMCRF